MTEWMWVDADNNQQGPCNETSLKELFMKGYITEESYVWEESMENWIEIGQVPGLISRLTVTVAPPPPVPTRNAPVRTSRHVNLKTNGTWIKMITADGVPYFYNDGTEAVSWDLPDELKTIDGEDYDDGSWIWFPDTREGYVPARMISQNRTGIVEAQLENGTRVKTTKGQTVFPLKISSLKRLEEDLVLLDNLDEGLIGYNLKQRYCQREIYTNIGTILVSINPYQMLPIYSIDTIRQYANKGNRKLKPHVYDIANAALGPCKLYNESQSILISGESGAGKTEATKQCLNFLAEVAGSEKNVEALILAANPILEAFGNAKTLRNDNSSRFGRFTEISFDKTGTISTARIENYLLEKSRVSFQQHGERNYHIFYQLFTHPDYVHGLGLERHDMYSFMNQSGCYTVDGMDDHREFMDVLTAFDSLGFTSDEINWVLSLTGAVLHLGNVSFRSQSINGAEGCIVANDRPLQIVAHLLECDEVALNHALVTRTIEIKREGAMTLPLKPHEATSSAHALAKSVYGNLFDWLVQRINQALAKGVSIRPTAFIGILDIFGFEIFKNNSFEQLCINFTNEKLQQLFNEHTFKVEQAIYISEGIKFDKIEYVDNQPILDLIEKRSTQGIMVILDDCNKMNATTDEKFVTKADAAHGRSRYYLTSAKTRRGATGFTILHYAGAVVYDGSGFLEKNKDLLYQDLYDVMATSKNNSTRALFPTLSKNERKNHSLGGQFRSQLNNLMKVLRNTNPHYIRCIKPNSNKAADEFGSQMVLEQLRYSGVFEAVSIRKKGFPFRYTFPKFVDRYRCLTLKNNRFKTFRNRNPKDQVTEILQLSKQDFSEMRIGRTMVLYRSEQHRVLELLRALSLEKVVSKLQAWWRGTLTRNWYKRAKGLMGSLRKACQSKNKATLERAITNFSKQMGHYGALFSVEPRDLYQARRMLFALTEWDRLAEELQSFQSADLTDDSNFETLRELVWKAATIADIPASAHHSALYEHAKSSWEGERKARCDPEIEKALRLLERDLMTSIYTECKRLKYEDLRLEEIIDLTGLSEDELLKEQYKKAKKEGMSGRAVMKEIELKERYLDNHGSRVVVFDHEHYMRLRHPIDYANAVLITFNRESLANSMLHWSTKPIPTSLTQLPTKPPQHKVAITLFKSLLCWMGERKSSTPELMAFEIASKGYADISLRAEIYCQLMKQMTQNPSHESQQRGWKMFALCILTFPPSPDLENFVLMFLRNNCPDKIKFIQQTHKIIYVGGNILLSANEVNSRINIFYNSPYQEEDWGAADEERMKEQTSRLAARGSYDNHGYEDQYDGGGYTASSGYNNHEAGHDTLLLPPAPPVVAMSQLSPPLPSLPEGWTQELTDEGEVYYYNHYTGDSSWDKP